MTINDAVRVIMRMMTLMIIMFVMVMMTFLTICYHARIYKQALRRISRDVVQHHLDIQGPSIRSVTSRSLSDPSFTAAVVEVVVVASGSSNTLIFFNFKRSQISSGVVLM